MRGAWLCAVVAIGCGRSGFDPLVDDERDAPGDTPADAAMTCPAGALLCDDFEAGDFAKWTEIHMNRPAGTIAVTTTEPRGGARSAEIVIPSSATNDAARALVLRVPTQTSGSIAVRAWFYLVTEMRDYSLVFVLRNTDTLQYLTAGGSPLGNWISSDNSAADQLSDHESATPVPALGTWFCFELAFDFATRRIQIFVDGAPALDDVASDPAPAYSDIALGIPKADNMGFAVFLDDVVIGSSRIGCQ